MSEATMYAGPTSAPLLDPDWLRAVATEVYSLCERMFSAGGEAAAARADGDLPRLLEALEQRTRLMHRIEPLLTPLAMVRASIRQGTLHDPALEQLVDEIAAWLQSILSATEELHAALDGDRQQVGRELQKLEHAALAQHAYGTGAAGGAVLDLVR
jgi:hypothetical protein